MKKSILNLTYSPIKDWLIQRISAFIILIYSIFIGICFFIFKHNFLNWKNFLNINFIKIINMIFILNLLAHTWIGMIAIISDYIKPISLKFIIELFIIFSLFYYFFWGLKIIFN